MPRYVALLRGVNVGGRNAVPMADLRVLVASLGYSEVTTFIASGNVLFSAAGRADPAGLADAIAERFGVPAEVAIRTAEELEAAVAGNPFPEADPRHLHVGFLTAPPAGDALAGIDAAAFLPERFALAGSEVYLELPAGVGRARLPALLDRWLGGTMTLRNWNTVRRLAELARG